MEYTTKKRDCPLSGQQNKKIFFQEACLLQEIEYRCMKTSQRKQKKAINFDLGTHELILVFGENGRRRILK
jgi:hypothetical protein